MSRRTAIIRKYSMSLAPVLFQRAVRFGEVLSSGTRCRTILIRPEVLRRLPRISYGRTKWGDARRGDGTNFIIDRSLPFDAPWRFATAEEAACQSARRADGTVIGWYPGEPVFQEVAA